MMLFNLLTSTVSFIMPFTLCNTQKKHDVDQEALKINENNKQKRILYFARGNKKRATCYSFIYPTNYNNYINIQLLLSLISRKKYWRINHVFVLFRCVFELFCINSLLNQVLINVFLQSLIFTTVFFLPLCFYKCIKTSFQILQ